MNCITSLKKFAYSIFSICFFAIFSSCNSTPADTGKESKAIGTMIDAWHTAAAKADYKTYFDLMADDAVFIGTDATENWDKKSFMVWAKPFFDRGKAWAFTSIQRHIFFDKSGNLAWFDELLSTQMKICRGSGVVVKDGNEWKIQQYVLSVTVPNDKLDSVISIKAPAEDSIINSLLKQ
jgi:ketosteroid isomerase-like protein